jgi:hypothetical protein
VLSAVLENFLADGFVELSIREHSRGQYDIRALVGFINHNIFDVPGLHESKGFSGTECPQIRPFRGGEGTELVEG